MLELQNYHGPEALREQLAIGRPLVLVARNSGTGGKRSRELAADEVFKAAEGLKLKVGLDLASVLPSKEAIIEGLQKSTGVRSLTADSKSFTNEYWITFLPAVNTILFVSTGSGKKLDAEYQQPFLQELISLTKTRKPALIFSNRLDRIFRRMLTAAELLNVLEVLKCFLGDATDGLRGWDSFESIRALYDSAKAEEEAARIPKKTRDGMSSNSDREMVGGAFRYSATSTPPPGLIRMTLLSAKGGKGTGMVYLDDPSHFPARDEVAIGFPNISGGKSQSNVELVQWALKHLGSPGYTHASVGMYLAQNGFSTPGYRKEHGVNAFYKPTEDINRRFLPVRAIVGNLDFYESGEFRILLGVEETPNFKIIKCFPCSGSWASPEDFERIKRYIKRNKGGGPASLCLVGVPVDTEFGTAKLIAGMTLAAKSRDAYTIKLVDHGNKRFGFSPLPHSALAKSIVEGLVKASETTWIPVESESLQVNPALRDKIIKIKSNLERSERQCEAILNQMVETDPDGNLLLDQGTRQALGLQRQKIVDHQIEPDKIELNQLEQQLFEEMEVKSHACQGAPINLLSVLVANLGDHSNTDYNKFWKSSLRINSLKQIRRSRRAHFEGGLEWEGMLKLSALSRNFEIPFSGQYLIGSATWMEDRISDAIKMMSEGTLFDDLNIPQLKALKPSIASALAMPSQTFNLGSCPDPRLLKIGVFIASHRELHNQAISLQLGEPELLVERVRKVIEERPYGSRWLRPVSARRARWFEIAADNAGIVKISDVGCDLKKWINDLHFIRRGHVGENPWVGVGEGVAQLEPCKYCQSWNRSSSRLFEVIGLVCLACHRDQAGIEWPSNPYDQWLDVNISDLGD